MMHEDGNLGKHHGLTSLECINHAYNIKEKYSFLKLRFPKSLWQH